MPVECDTSNGQGSDENVGINFNHILFPYLNLKMVFVKRKHVFKKTSDFTTVHVHCIYEIKHDYNYNTEIKKTCIKYKAT